MTTTEMETGSRQEEVLRLLDTRMACLLVDRSNAEALRPQLLRLREKLAREPLESTTLDRVEALVFESRSPRERNPRAGVARARRKVELPRPRIPSPELVARGVAGIAGMLVLADLTFRIVW